MLAVVVLLCVAVAPGVADTYNLPKFVALTILGLVLLVIGIWRLITTTATTVRIPTDPLVGVVVAMVAAGGVAAAVAPATGLALFGTYGRYDGLLTLLACVVLFAVVVRMSDAQWLGRLAAAMIITGGFVGLVALGQAVVLHQASVRSTIGNPDFLSAYLGIVSPIALAAVLDASARRSWRATAAVVLVVTVAGALATGAEQGPLAAAIGLTAVLIVWITDRLPQRRRWLLVSGIVAVLILALLVLGVYRAGPLAFVGRQRTVAIRRIYWHLSLRMFSHHLITGVGLGSFGDHYFQYWSRHATHTLGTGRFADAANDVPLMMLAQGGLLLGLSYLAFLAVIARRLVRAVWMSPAANRSLLVGFGGAWLAYQAQSLISIDKITLVVLHWTLAGAIVGLTGVGGREVRLRWRGRTAPGRNVGHWIGRGALVASCLVALAGTVPLLDLIRADTAFGHAQTSRNAAQAAADDRLAAKRASWFPLYADSEGQALASAGDLTGALAAYSRALGADPIDRTARLGVADAHVALNQLDAAAEDYAELARDDHHDPVLLTGLAVLALRRHDPQAAIQDLQHAQRLHPTTSVSKLLHLARTIAHQ